MPRWVWRDPELSPDGEALKRLIQAESPSRSVLFLMALNDPAVRGALDELLDSGVLEIDLFADGE